MFKTQSISYESTQAFSPLFLDYINQKEDLLNFCDDFPSLESFKQKMEQRNFPAATRETLVNAISHQYTKAHQELPAAIKILKQQNSYTITAGHQLCLLGGPLFVAYKILAAIKYTRELKTHFPACEFVPVFWMASEDHDFEEINNITLFQKKIIWNKAAKGAVGRLFTEDLKSQFLPEIEAILGNSEMAILLKKIIHDSYANHQNLADATRYFIHQLFGAEELVIVDGDDPLLKALFKDSMKKDIQDHISLDEVTKTSKSLLERNYKVQVNPREINFFYLEDQIRERLIPNEHGYSVLNTPLQFSKEAFFDLMDKNPEKISPNVVTRALYQEFVLPNLGTVLGPGELSYWLEFKSMFHKHVIPFPLLLVRPSFLIVDEADQKKQNKLKIPLEDLFKEETEIIKKYISNNLEVDISENLQNITEQLNAIKAKGLQVDEGLETYFNAEITRHLNALDSMDKKINQAHKKKHETTLQQITSLKQKLFPNNQLQEREISFLEMLLKFGPSFQEAILSEINLFEKNFKVLNKY